MIKKTFLAAMITLLFTAAEAQIFRFGGKVGTNVSKIAGNSFEKKFEYGYHVGGFAQVKLTHRLTLQPEVLFSQINTTVDSNFKSLYTSLYNPGYIKNVQLKYLTIPLVLNYNLNKFISFQAGAQYGKLVDNNKNLFQNGRAAFKEGDLAALAGMQLQFGKIMISGRYVVGVNNINDIDDKDKWKNQTAQISLGYRF